ncbi:DUF924 family protein [Andreprevotia chitinilytica]|uniref:DUF924 family protein n=1 Tax=Andreprevotia chitinilytica TaxID=396808 RepID=UPI001FE09D0A|nr:DUF924 family protein [Andreprevotia chitinilytica]
MTRLIRRASPEGRVKSGRTAVVNPEDVLTFWFGPPPLATRPVWFQRDDAFDATIRRRFLTTLEAAGRGECAHWAQSAHGALALVIVLDQFPRNLYRGEANAFAFDAQAREVANTAIAANHPTKLTPLEQLFLYLPFEHSEQLADQERAVALMAHWQDNADLAGFYHYAVMHRAVISRFGRFPHRNAALGRASTDEERAYLAEPGAGF